MLRELHISNLAVIADAAVELDAGLNCFTGQTGAGKSLLIGALEILLGLRQPQDMLRKGAPEGRVTGVFHIASAKLRQELANVTDLPLAEEPEIMIARRIHESGRTSASINGNPITGSMLKAVGETLVDVHGQHDLQYLLKPANQLSVIDDFGAAAEKRLEFSEAFRKRAELIAQQKELTTSRTLRQQQLELYSFQAKEIDDAGLVAGEQEELQARHKVLNNLEKIKKQASATYGVLYEDEGSAVERVKTITNLLLDLAEFDENLKPIADQVKDAAAQLDDAAYSLRRYTDKLDLDPEELAEVADRLNLVNRLADKYGGSVGTVEEVLTYREQIGRQLEELKKADADFSGIGKEIERIEKELKTTGDKLSALRKAAVNKLVPLVQGQLADLGMKDATFHVELVPAKTESDPFGVSSGLESVEFMIAPNPGQPARPLRKIASGGELSRIMLAIKSILAQADRVSVLVFDEIDANVGGRMGTIIGEKLRALASVHQVLCITHLPQIASFADRHLTIRKAVQKGESYTTVTTMDGDERIHELAEMITGKDVSETSLAQARELLSLAQERPSAKAKSCAVKIETGKITSDSNSAKPAGLKSALPTTRKSSATRKR